MYLIPGYEKADEVDDRCLVIIVLLDLTYVESIITPFAITS